jgi:hypothetical protein
MENIKNGKPHPVPLLEKERVKDRKNYLLSSPVQDEENWQHYLIHSPVVCEEKWQYFLLPSPFQGEGLGVRFFQLGHNHRI